MCIIFIGLEFIDPVTCPRVCYQIVSGPCPNRTYGFASPAGLWKVVTMVLVFVISPVVINKLIGSKAVPQVHCDLIQATHIMFLLLIFVYCILRLEEAWIYKD